MVAAQGKEAVGIALLFSFAFICARFLLDSLVYKEEVVRPPAAMVAAQGKEAVGIALLFSFAFICARFLLDSLVYKVQ
nr:unnamed protein product [Digitaria exilis]